MADAPDITFIEGEEPAAIEMRSASQREMDIRIMPWGQAVYHENGWEAFLPGAFSGVDPTKVRLLPPTDDGKHRHMPVGRGLKLEERSDAAYLTVKVAQTQAGDELLALVQDGVITGASVGFIEKPGGSSARNVSGRRVRVHERVDLDHVAITWKPAYETAGVVAMRSAHEKGEPSVGEAQEAPTTGAPETAAPVIHQVDTSGLEKAFANFADKIDDRVAKIEERARMEIDIPARKEEPAKAKLYQWAHMAVRLLSGEKVSQRELQERALQDVTTGDTPGVVPDSFSGDLIGLINPSRPFLQTTRQIPAPASGMSIVVPVLGTRATVDVQANEKTDIDSTTPTVTTTHFDAVSIFGGADVSIQLIRRSDPSFMDLLLQELGEAYARKSDEEALSALDDAGMTPGTGTLDPADLSIGEAWANSISNYGKAPTHIWLSSDGVSKFIDAKADGTNAPLYGSLGSAFDVAGGPGGRILGLQPVYVPALDTLSIGDVIIGPSAGFAWAEDGTFQLSADNPGKAGRDIALGGILFLMPRYPTAFTSYSV